MRFGSRRGRPGASLPHSSVSDVLSAVQRWRRGRRAAGSLSGARGSGGGHHPLLQRRAGRMGPPGRVLAAVVLLYLVGRIGDLTGCSEPWALAGECRRGGRVGPAWTPSVRGAVGSPASGVQRGAACCGSVKNSKQQQRGHRRNFFLDFLSCGCRWRRWRLLVAPRARSAHRAQIRSASSSRMRRSLMSDPHRIIALHRQLQRCVSHRHRGPLL